MASSGSLMGFVNQLQNLELQMASILMEAAMKLASMTDASVFILVEHSGGRYFSGKRHLCDSYLNHRLSPVGNDVEMEVNPEISALQERSHPFFPNSQPSPSPTVGSVTSPLGLNNSNPSETSRPETRKRSSSSANHQKTVTPTKRTRYTHNLKQEATSEGFNVQDQDATFDSSLSMVPAYDHGNESDTDIICEDEEAAFQPDTSFNSERCTEVAVNVISDSEKQWIFAEILQHPKLEAVKQICDESVSDKSSVSSKLLNSLLYDFSKVAAAKCPFRHIEDPKCKQFYSLCFEEIWNQLPNLQILHERGAKRPIGQRSECSLKASCRWSCRRNFFMLLKRQNAQQRNKPDGETWDMRSPPAGRERTVRTACRDLFRRNFFTLIKRQNKKDGLLKSGGAPGSGAQSQP